MAEIFKFPRAESATIVAAEKRTASHRLPQAYRGSGVNIRTLCFRSYDLIVEADEAELLRDVRLDTRKAEVKLRKVKERLQGEQERSAALIELLTMAETRLSAAIVVALLSTRGEKSDGS